MAINMTSIQRLTARKKKTPTEKARLIALIAEATVDAYQQLEQRMGFYTMLQEHLDMPFEATILGVSVVVKRVKVTDDERIVAICRRGRSKQYEFVAIDHPLSLAVQKKLRAITSRATITATRLVNTHEWGDFKGDPHALVTRCFDAFLYYANWGTRHLMLRVPVAKLDTQLALQYCARRQTRSRRVSSVATVSVNKTHLVFSW
jgi:hypothetical protein